MVKKYDRRHRKFSSVDPVSEGKKSIRRVEILQMGEMASPDNLTENGGIGEIATLVLVAHVVQNG